MNPSLLLGFLLVFCCFNFIGVQGSYVLIGTPRGVLTASWNPSGSYSVRETTDWASGLYMQHWKFETDSRFPNGQFIRNRELPHLVWDASGFTVTAGTKLILYPKKNTQYETQNQRWIRTPGGNFHCVMNYNAFAKVNTTNSDVTLQWGTSSPYQNFTLVNAEDAYYIGITNSYEDVTIYLSTRGPFGTAARSLSPPGYTMFPVSVGAGFFVDAKFANGSFVPGTPFAITRLNSNLRFPIRAPFPTGARIWRGWLSVEGRYEVENYDMELTFTLSNFKISPGSGSDRSGSFTYNGTYDEAGAVNFVKTYAPVHKDDQGRTYYDVFGGATETFTYENPYSLPYDPSSTTLAGWWQRWLVDPPRHDEASREEYGFWEVKLV